MCLLVNIPPPGDSLTVPKSALAVLNLHLGHDKIENKMLLGH